MPTFVALTLSSFSYEMDMSIRLDILQGCQVERVKFLES